MYLSNASCVFDNISSSSNNRNGGNNQPGFGPTWPSDFEKETLIPTLLSRTSGVNISLKVHVRRVQRYMIFLTENAISLPVRKIDV